MQISQYLISAFVSSITAIIVVFINNRLQKRNAIALEKEKLKLAEDIKRTNTVFEIKNEISAQLQRLKSIITSIEDSLRHKKELTEFIYPIRDASDQLNQLYGKYKHYMGAAEGKAVHDGLHIVNDLRFYVSYTSEAFINEEKYIERLKKARRRLNDLQNSL